MVNCTCMVQSGQVPDNNQASLQQVLAQFIESTFGQSASIRWIAVPAGCGFTAGVPSTSSIVSMTAPEPLAQENRAALLTKLCDLWMNETDCSINEIVAVISDP